MNTIHEYDKYIWVDDMKLPGLSAKIVKTIKWFSFVTFVPVAGQARLADAIERKENHVYHGA